MNHDSLNAEQKQLIDRLIFGEIDVQDSALARAMLQDPSFATEVRALEKTLGAVSQELASTARAAEENLTEGPDEIPAQLSDEFPDAQPTPEDVESTQALLAAVTDPTQALTGGGHKRNLVLKICVPAAAIVLAWATLYEHSPEGDLDAKDRTLLGDQAFAGELVSNNFSIVILPNDLDADQYELELVTDDDQWIIQSGPFLGPQWPVPDNQRTLLEGHDQVQVHLRCFKNRRSELKLFLWKR